jgi:MFS family permease
MNQNCSMDALMESLVFIRQNFRWLIAGFLLAFFGSFGQTYFVSIYAGELQSEFSLTHGEWGGIYMVGTLLSAFTMFFVGGLTDVFRARTLSVIVMMCLALACLSMSVISSAFLLVFAVFVLRLFGQGLSSHIAMVSMARWFVATRGRALAFAALGFAFGQAILPLSFVAISSAIGWRQSWLIAAGIAICAAPLLYVLLIRERTPQAVAKENNSTGMHGRHWTRNQVLKHWLFWFILPAYLGPATFGTSFFFHQVHFAEFKGWTHLQFVALFPLLTGLSVLVTMTSGWVIDRFKSGRLMQFYVFPFAISVVLFWYVDSLTGAAIAMSIMAITIGLQSTLSAAFWAEYFGTQYLGSIKSMATVAMVFGSAIGPGLTGWLIDNGVAFVDQMLGIAVYLLIATVMTTIGVRKSRGLS